MSQLSLDLYKDLYLIRSAEEYIIKVYEDDDMKTPMHMSMGQEAASVAICRALRPDDQIFGSYRSHAAFLAKTNDTDSFFAEMYGKTTGTARGKSGSMHLAAPEQGHMVSSAVVASCLPLALGAGFASKQQNAGRVAVVFFGDGAVDEGVFWESINVAALMKLPVVFVCEDNDLAQHSTKSMRQGYKSIIDIVNQFDFSVFDCDTTDVEPMYEMATEAVRSARENFRPSFFKVQCYRYLEHVGIYQDFDAGYRTRESFEDWNKNDSVSLQRQRLIANGYSESDIQQQELAIDQRIEASMSLAMESDFPGTEELHTGVFFEEN
jgi:TPP-dependent pyruvate/acetoin dehydrogenase alpha subunit